MAKNLKQKSAMTHDFSLQPRADISRSNFRRSRTYKTTFDSSYLIPIFLDEVLPGDSMNVKLTSVARLATPIVPIMDNIKIDFFFFYVPNRLLWDNWKRFMGERDPDPDSSIDYSVPQVVAPSGGFAVGTLYDYFGIPTEVPHLPVNALHSRAYNLIWNEWFRCSYLQDSVTVDKGNGPDTYSNYVLLKRNKRFDYLTSALPWPQRGDEIELPLGDTAPVVNTWENSIPVSGDYLTTYNPTTGNRHSYSSTAQLGMAATGAAGYGTTAFTSTAAIALGLEADLSQATASTINSLREAFQLQKMLEKDARAGSRYKSIVWTHFNVNIPDSRAQRPEYLGGGSTNVMIDSIAQTSEPSSDPLGTLGAVGYHAHSGIGFSKSFTEHGVILGLMCAYAGDLTYQTSLNRMWSRQSRVDYYWPSLQALGEQEILNKEVFCVDHTTDTDSDGTVDNDEIWGYQERWSEYRYAQSMITGKLRSSYATSLDVWHLSQDFASLPDLNSDFIEENPPIDRIVAVPSEPEFIFDGYFDVLHTRPLPSRGVPGLIDHF